MSSLLLLSSFLLAAPILQEPPQKAQPMGTATFSFKRTCSADLDNSGQADLAVVRDNQLDIMGDPGTFGWTSGHLGTVRDIAVLEPVGEGERATLVSVGNEGLEEWSEFERVDGNGNCDPVKTALSGSAWDTSRLVATAVLPNEGRPRIVGVLSDNRTIRTLYFDGEEYVDYELSFNPAIDEDIKDLAIVDYTGDPVEPYDESSPTITILTPTKVRIYTLPTAFAPSGPTATTHVATLAAPTGWTETCMTVGTYPAPELDPDQVKQWIAVVVTSSNGTTQYLTVVDGAGAHSAMLLGTPDVVAMDAGRYDNNTSMDLVLGNNGSNTLWILKNTSTGTPAFSTSGSNKLVLTHSGSTGTQNTQAYPCLTDIDNDTDLDVLYPVRPTSSILVCWNREVFDDSKYNPVFANDFFHATLGRPWLVKVGTTLTFATTVLLPTEAPSAPNLHLQVAVFRKAAPPDETETERTAFLVGELIDWDTISSQTQFDVDCVLHDPVYSYSPGTGSQVVQFENLYIIMSRLVSLNEDDTIRYAFPASWQGVEAAIGDDNMHYFEDLSELTPFNVKHTEYGTTGTIVGTMSVLPYMPTPPQQPIVIANP